MRYKTNRAFTLIELLVVIAIIGILVTISLFGLQGARESARDARRKSDLAEIKAALEMYRSDAGAYPSSLPAPGNPLTFSGNTYMSSVPDDPQPGVRSYAYTTFGTPPRSYLLCASLEGETAEQISCGSCGETCSYKITSP